MSSLLRLEREQKDSHITPSYLFIWNENDKYVHALQYSLEKHSLIQTKIGKSLYPFSDRKGAKTIPIGAAHSLPIRQM